MFGNQTVLPVELSCFLGAAPIHHIASLLGLAISAVDIRRIDFTSPSFTALPPSLSLPSIILVEAMCPKLPSFPLLRLFRKGHDAKKSEKSKTKKDGVVTSSIMPATIPTSIAGTFVRGGESSQPETSCILPIVDPGSIQQVTSIAQPASSVQQPATTVSAEPPTLMTSPTPTITSDTIASIPSLPELWDRAYDELKSKESKLVDAYEKILSRELKGVEFCNIGARRERD
jgi:hypothetical protein